MFFKYEKYQPTTRTEYATSITRWNHGGGWQTLLPGSGDQTVKFWRVSDGTFLREINAGTHVGAVAISPDGEQVATGGGRGDNYYHNHRLAYNPTLWGASISVWRFADGQLIRSITVNRRCLANTVHSIRYSRDGRYLGATNYQDAFCNSYDAPLKIFSATDGSELYSFNFGGNYPWTTCFDIAPACRSLPVCSFWAWDRLCSSVRLEAQKHWSSLNCREQMTHPGGFPRRRETTRPSHQYTPHETQTPVLEHNLPPLCHPSHGVFAVFWDRHTQ